MARKSGFVRRHGRMVRETRWLDLPTTGVTLSGANSTVILLSLTAVELALRPFTIVRTRGVWQTGSDQLAASELYETSLGMCVVSDQALAIGITAVPTPEEDRESDLWFVYETRLGQFDFISLIGFESQMDQTPFESKAMRKVEDGQDVILVVQNSSTSAGAGVTVAGRLLIKLH